MDSTNNAYSEMLKKMPGMKMDSVQYYQNQIGQ